MVSFWVCDINTQRWNPAAGHKYSFSSFSLYFHHTTAHSSFKSESWFNCFFSFIHLLKVKPSFTFHPLIIRPTLEFGSEQTCDAFIKQHTNTHVIPYATPDAQSVISTLLQILPLSMCTNLCACLWDFLFEETLEGSIIHRLRETKEFAWLHLFMCAAWRNWSNLMCLICAKNTEIFQICK